MSWIVRVDNDRAGHFVDCYATNKKLGYKISKSNIPYRSHIENIDGSYCNSRLSNFDVWLIDPVIYKGRYRNVFLERESDPLQDRAVSMLITHSSAENKDVDVSYLLLEEQLVLKPMSSYHDYNTFRDNVQTMLGDIILALGNSHVETIRELEKAGFQVCERGV